MTSIARTLSLVVSLLAVSLPAAAELAGTITEPPPAPSAGAETASLFVDETVDPRLNPAVNHLLDGEAERARALIAATLPELERESGLYSPQLLLPYVLLAEAQEATGRLAEADDSLTRAQHVVHRAWGSTSLRQLPLVQRRADLNIRLGKQWSGEQLSALAVRIAREQEGPASTAFVEAAVRHGRRLRELAGYKESLSELRRAIREVEEVTSREHPLLVPLLRERARSFLGGPLAGRSLWMMRRAARIMDANRETFSAAERVAGRVEYGDLLMIFSYESAAVREYEAAWALADAEGEFAFRAALEAPQIVRYRTFIPEQSALAVDAEFAFELDITDDGRPRNVQVIASTAEDVVNHYAPRIVFSEVRYRPAIRDGEAQPVQGHREALVMGVRQPGAPRVRRLFRLPERAGPSASLGF